MIKKVFKTIFILTLTLGITLPSNAAGSVQVSDGSAFVTKSEMSFKLNNLSKRMTELENSMDSKIDKLVSSYLTRNGVWNGTPQELTAAVKNKRKYSFYSNWGSGNIGTQFKTIVHFSDCIVQKVSKTGLVFGSFGYGNEHAGNANNWYYGGFDAIADSTSQGWIWDQNVVVSLTFYQTEPGTTDPTTGEIKFVVRIGNSLGIWNWAGINRKILIAIPLPNWNIVPFTFFADKGKEIWWRWTDEVSFYTIGDWHDVTASGSTMKVVLYDLSIY